MAALIYTVKCKDRNPGVFHIRQTTPSRPGNFVDSMTSTLQNDHAPLKNALARDLVRIGKGFFLCDRAFRRSKGLGGKTRIFEITIPVENRKKWEKIKVQLEEWAQFVSHDIWKINFSDFSYVSDQLFALRQDLKNPVISLFSDGLDSLCGACYAMSNNENGIFVSHNPPGFATAKKKVEKIAGLLDKEELRYHLVNFQFEIRERDSITGRRNKFPEFRRRTRPLLYLSMAGAIALELKVKKIRLNENGILAINLPITANRMGVANSRHAHPETLKKFEDILNKLHPRQNFKVENPFFYQTKGEQTIYLKAAAELVPETISCEFGNRQLARIKNKLETEKSLKECGLCIPCLIRRIALYTAGIKEPSDHYAYSVADAMEAIKTGKTFKRMPLFDLLKDGLTDILEFAKKIEVMESKEFVSLFFYELSSLTRDPNEVPVMAKQVYNLYRRFAKESISFFEEIGNYE